MTFVKPHLEAISGAVQKIYRDAVDPVGERFAFEQRPTEGEIAGPPTVLLLGNHSSGKSTFINHLLGEDIQKTGLAPTDDSFTILSGGDREEVREGKAVVSNPDLSYGGLGHFGPEFLSHFQMKRCPIELLREVTLIDTPGMIDAAKEESGRGYDFTGAVRWFAERADMVLVFFDPDKPGTTGETLQVFTQALHGIDHKLRIVLNKMDRFASLQDFARAYGALCWNLGKVIPRKDLPLIYTTYVPVADAPQGAIPLNDFDESREELIREIRRAPERRVDNMLTQAADHADRLRMHSRVLDRAARDLRQFRFKLWSLVVMLVLVGGLVGAASIGLKAEWWVPASIFIGTVGLGYLGILVIRGLVQGEERKTTASLQLVFEHLYARELLIRDRSEDLTALWERVHPRLRQTLEKLGMISFPRLRPAELKRLSAVLEGEIPELRSKLHRDEQIGGSSEG